MSETNFIDPNKKTKYGQDGVQIWIGTVVGFDSQKEQIESGWGWRYKVRIDGDHAAGSDLIKDDELSYATCLLPTTAGSGAAYKLRSVRISQGDTVFGVRGGGQGAPTMILGVLPRTKYTKNSSGNFGMLSGFWGNGTLSDTEILSGQFNDQVGPEFLKGASGLEPGEWTKATADNPSKEIKKIVPQVKENQIITEEDTKKTNVEEKVGKVNENWKPGDNLNTATMKYLEESFEKGELSAEDYKAALKQASEQGLDGYEESVIEEDIKEIEKEEVKKEVKKEELKKVNKKSKAIEVLSKAYPYVDTSGIKTYADYVAEGVKITEIGPNSFSFTYPNGKVEISRQLGSSNAPTVESRFDSLAFILQKNKQDDLIEKQKRDEEERKRKEEQRKRNIEWAKKFPNLYNPDGTRKK